MLHFLTEVVSFIVILGFIVVVHEFGHFAAAKLCGVRVDAFSVGFGPRLFGIKRGDTDYKVCLLPLGGYVKMAGGDIGENNDAAQAAKEDPGAFTSHPRWQRMIIGFAGPFANFVLAFLLMGAVYMMHNETPEYVTSPVVLDWVPASSQAARAGLQPGDHITHFDGTANPSFEDLFNKLQVNIGHSAPIEVERNGKIIATSLFIPEPKKGDTFDLSAIGLIPAEQKTPIRVQKVETAQLAAAGVKDGDTFERVDGHVFHSVSALRAYLLDGQGKPVHLDLGRNGQIVSATVTPTESDKHYQLGFFAVQPPYRMEQLAFLPALEKSADYNLKQVSMIFDMLTRLFTHRVSVGQLSGPVGIAKMSGEVADTHDWLLAISFTAMLSINLGIMNLLPVPILDGGLILMLLIESLLRRDIQQAVKERIYQLAFVGLIAFFVFITVNDVSKLSFFSRLGH